MGGKTIGKQLNNGYAGSFARTPDMIINTRAAEGNDIPFGSVLIRGTNGNQVKKSDASIAMTNFLGIAGKEVKTIFDYSNQDEGVYKEGEAVPVFQRGSINVICKNGTPAAGGDVFVAKTTSAFTGAQVGDICQSATGTLNTDYIKLTNCQWGGTADANGVAELVILTRANA